MPYKVFAVEEVLASADVNNYLMRQVVIACTSGTRPVSPNKGMTIFETDTDRYYGYDGSQWREFAMLNPPSANVMRTSSQSIPSSAQTVVTFQDSFYNWRMMWNPGQPTRLTVPSIGAGVYNVGGAIEYTANATGSRQCLILVNGAVVARQTSDNAGSGPAARVSVSREIALKAGDYIELAGFQNSGVTLDMENNQRQPELWARRVGPS